MEGRGWKQRVEGGGVRVVCMLQWRGILVLLRAEG